MKELFTFRESVDLLREGRKTGLTKDSMVLTLDGNSEHVAHV